MKLLTRDETADILHRYGIDKPYGTGFAFRDHTRNTTYDWHAHPYHQLIYAASGAMRIETEAGQHILPLGQAVWIPANIRHRTTIMDMDSVSLYFSPDCVMIGAGRVRILHANPLMREMILYATRWPVGASEQDPLARCFFQSLAMLCGEWLEDELPLFLPGARSTRMTRAMDYALAAPGQATQAGAIAAAALSERSFRRSFQREAGMNWQAWLTQARMLHAMSLLMEGQQVTIVAAECGYTSLSAFAKAFAAVAGENPSVFRARQTQS
ncbi:AraC family transcriptional regulator [Granulibacter bethesdensis]|uniref:AraC family transcriptional regulator n=1 Tax=Granulibacter bethesdensis TaxID=364410 RepID=UPI0003F21764|nr:helix-turn-helix transcriptional regulator [Granulibacter bethesdensis]AHJ67300.1 Transcriptional regulator, AraC family [Granulibacter bethesdensis]